MRFLTSWLLGPIAVVLGLLATALALTSSSMESAVLAIAAHVVAAAFGVLAAERRRGGLLASERDSVWIAALFVPCFGAVLAWIGPRGRDAESLANAHQSFEHYEARVRPVRSENSRTLLTGDHDRDVVREIDVRRHQRVLHTGSTVERLNALRCLARLARSRDMQIVRSALVDPEEEVRLFAHALLDGSMTRHGAAIVAAREALEERPDDPAAVAELVRVHFELAASGVLDARTSRYHYRSAARAATSADIELPVDAARSRYVALALARTGDSAAAAAELEELPAAERDAMEVRLAEAEVAYRARDLSHARAQHAELAAAGRDVPVWLDTLAGVAPAETAELTQAVGA